MTETEKLLAAALIERAHDLVTEQVATVLDALDDGLSPAAIRPMFTPLADEAHRLGYELELLVKRADATGVALDTIEVSVRFPEGEGFRVEGFDADELETYQRTVEAMGLR